MLFSAPQYHAYDDAAAVTCKVINKVGTLNTGDIKNGLVSGFVLQV